MVITVEPRQFARRFIRSDRKFRGDRDLYTARMWAERHLARLARDRGLAHTKPRVEVIRDPFHQGTQIIVSFEYAILDRPGSHFVVRERGWEQLVWQ